MKRLSYEEWEKRYKANAARQNKRRHQAKIYLKNNYMKKIICKVCHVFGYVRVQKITDSKVRLYCSKCKNSRTIRVSLPKSFVPSK